MYTHPRLSRSTTIFLLTLALLFGAYARLTLAMQNDFPILDGGLFYAMTNDLLANHWRLPLTTSYNHLDIPFAYPPLPFYLLGGIHSLTGVDLLILLRWLPALLSLLTVPVFYLMARTLLESEPLGALATLIFAMLPRAWEWLIMGGGITRATGTLFFLLFIHALYRTFRDQKASAAWYAGLWGGLILLSHPERALHAAVSGLLFWLWWDRTREGIQKAFLIASITLIIGTPWWIPLLVRHGIETLSLASQTAGPRWLFWLFLLQVNFTDEPVVIAGLLIIYGLWWSWKGGEKWLTFWLLLIMLSDPRSAPHLIPIPGSLLSALALARGVFPILLQTPHWEKILFQRSGRLFFSYLLILMLYNLQSTLLELKKLVLSHPARESLLWISAHTPTEARFLALDWYPEPAVSPVLEWFPALARRNNITTLQGREWLDGNTHFNTRYKADHELRECLYQDVYCLEEWSTTYQERFDYIYLALETPDGKTYRSALSEALRRSPEYQLVYESPEILIFQRR